MKSLNSRDVKRKKRQEMIARMLDGIMKKAAREPESEPVLFYPLPVPIIDIDFILVPDSGDDDAQDD